MAKNNNLTDFLTDIADTIREENGTTELINPQDFGSKITGIGNKLRGLVRGTLRELKASDLRGISEIGPYAFYKHECLESVIIPNSVTSIGSGAFWSCTGLTSIAIPDRVLIIGSNAFSGCKGLTSITIPDSVMSIGEGVFYGCTGLTSVTIPSSVTSIGIDAFRDCTGLTSVVYRGRVLISARIFNGCTKIAKYDFRNAAYIPTLSNKAYLGHAAGCKIIVSDVLYDSWKAATNWSALTDVVWVKASKYTEG